MKIMIFGNYTRLTLQHVSNHVLIPGQCAKVNGKWLAVSESTNSMLTFVVPNDSPLLLDTNFNIEFPVGPGFSHLDATEVSCIAGGAGIGTMVSVVSYRLSQGLTTSVQMYGRNVTKDDVTAAFPVLNEVDFGCWNTCHWGRPTMSEILVMPTDHYVYFAGPKSLFDDLKSYSSQHKIILNY
jgi:hypothetical protein